MPWVRLDEEFARHPKVAVAGPLGIAMQVAALCYCNQYLTDGFVPAAVPATLLNLDGLGMRMWKNDVIGGGEDAAADLIVADLTAAGLWEEVPGGYLIHDYHEFQPSREQVLAERESAKRRQQDSRARRKQKALSQGESRELSQRDTPVSSAAPVPVPVAVPVSNSTTRPVGSNDEETATAAEMLLWTIRPKFKDDGTRKVVLTLADEVGVDGVKEVLSALKLAQADGSVRHDAKWVVEALGKRARKKAAA